MLHALSKISPAPSEVLCFYCFDQRLFTRTCWGSLKCYHHRAKFLLESVDDLRCRLRELGNDLLVAYGHPEDIVPNLIKKSSPNIVLLQDEITSEEKEIIANIKFSLSQEKMCEIRMISDYSLLHKDDLPFHTNLNDLPISFTQFRKTLEKYDYHIRPLHPKVTMNQLPFIKDTTMNNNCVSMDNIGYDYLPTVNQLYSDCDLTSHPHSDPRSAFPFLGGETAAIHRIQSWIFDNHHLDTYFNTRNGFFGTDYSSKLSPYLAVGCVSPRYSSIVRCLSFSILHSDYFHTVCLWTDISIGSPSDMKLIII